MIDASIPAKTQIDTTTNGTDAKEKITKVGLNDGDNSALINRIFDHGNGTRDNIDPGFYIKPVNDNQLFGSGKFPDSTINLGGEKLTPEDKQTAIRDLNHETAGMVEPGKETDALRGANAALINGDMKAFGEAFKGLSKEERQHVVDSMNQAFEKTGSDTRIHQDRDGNIIVENGQPGEEGHAVRVNPDTGKAEEVTGKRDGKEYIVTGVSTGDPTETGKRIGDDTARDLIGEGRIIFPSMNQPNFPSINEPNFPSLNEPFKIPKDRDRFPNKNEIHYL